MPQPKQWTVSRLWQSSMARRGAISFFLVIAFVLPLYGQFDQLVSPKQTPQARSQQELDDYLAILDTNSALERSRQLEAFRKTYPESELLGIAHQLSMTAYRELGDFERMLESGRRALEVRPNNLNTLTALADAIPNRVTGEGQDDRRLLDEAEAYAQGIFAGIDRMVLPHSILPEQWRLMRLEMEASAHESLGHIASKHGQWQRAVAEFEKATEQNPHPRGSQFYRLGVAYMFVGSHQAAEVALRRAIELGPEEIRSLANVALQKGKRVQKQ